MTNEKNTLINAMGDVINEVTKERAEIMKKEPDSQVSQRNLNQQDFLMEILKNQEIGNLKLTPEQQQILKKEITNEEILIKPQGQIYADWTFYANRLDNAFGIGQWALIPIDNIQKVNNLLLWDCLLFLNGKLHARAKGEQEYIESNYNMSWGDAIAGTQSNALARCCKNLVSGARKLWNKSFVQEWIEDYAEQYTDTNGRKKWRKKKSVSVDDETGEPRLPLAKISVVESPKQPVNPIKVIKKEDDKRTKLIKGIFAKLSKLNISEDERKKMIKENYGVESSKDMTVEQLEDFYNRIESSEGM